MMGYEYANTYRRIIDSRNKFDREFHSVMKWDTNTLDTTKVKIFGDYSKYRTSGYGLFGYNKNSTGVFVLNTHETPTIGNRYGWFAGLSQDNFYFKNNSSSVEKSLNGELGYHIENSYGHNNKYLLRIGIDGSYRKMNRKYNIFGNSFATKSRYNSIGTFADIKYSKDIRISKNTRIEPKIGFQFAADKLTHINEKNGPIKLKVRERALFTATPKAEILISHTKEKNNDLKVETNLNYSVFKTYRKYSYLKGKISNGNTTYYYFPKDNFKINSELTFGIELQKPNYGLGTKVFYDLNRKSIGYQLEYRLKF